MEKIKQLVTKTTRFVMDKLTGNGLMQEENVVQGERRIMPGMPEIIRELAAEGIVLLKNENKTLPLQETDVVSVFGRCQNDWFYVGYGSGGDVHPPYQVSLMDGLRLNGVACNESLAKTYADWSAMPENAPDHGWWGHWPYYHEDMPLTQELVEKASKESSVALFIIGRAAGEDRENVLEPGSFYLTDREKENLRLVCGAFQRVALILDCGNIMDLSFTEEIPMSAIVYAWQLGQESGNAIAEVLTGKVNPSGKLSDTIARTFAEYPSSPYFGKKEYNNYTEDIYVGYRYFETFGKDALYPFGFGLSYTTFSMEKVSATREEYGINLEVKVTNTGDVAGKEVVQIYCVPAEGKLSKSRKNLVAYGKTNLLQPGESQVLKLHVRDIDCASYDDSGVTGFKNAFVLEAGSYALLMGNCVTTETEACRFTVKETGKLRQCREACAPVDPFPVMTRWGMVPVRLGERDLRKRILRNLPKEIPVTGDRGIKLPDVAAGKASLEAFVAQLSDRELGDLSRGEGMMGSTQGTPGNAGVFGGITESLREKGIPPLTTADGPAGLRLKLYTTLLPCGTAIACSWNDALTEDMFRMVGKEGKELGVDVILSPGMNIHRNPLCGRNFEYYSEDPYLCGKIAAAAVRGIQDGGISACPKHFAANNQEVNRNYKDSRMSQRALREIYLKCFEIMVKESKPQNIMTSYNKINGVWNHYNYDLVTTILREEWGYEGNIVTDWWMRYAACPEFPKVKDNAYRVRAQVDVLMPGGVSFAKQKYEFDKAQVANLNKAEHLTRAELQRTAMNVLRFALLRIKAKAE